MLCIVDLDLGSALTLYLELFGVQKSFSIELALVMAPQLAAAQTEAISLAGCICATQ